MSCMTLCSNQAQKAKRFAQLPIGAVIFDPKNNRVLSASHDMRNCFILTINEFANGVSRTIINVITNLN